MMPKDAFFRYSRVETTREFQVLKRAMAAR